MSKISWTEKTINPVFGCTKIAAGCKNCYALRMANRLAGIADAKISKGKSRKVAIKELATNPYIRVTTRGKEWLGEVICDESVLDKLTPRQKPKMIFMCSMADLFHEKVPFEFIDKVMAKIWETPQHTYQVLTKRPERMAEYFKYYCMKEATGVPLPSLWLGTSISTPGDLHKIHYLKHCPASKRFLSIEPLLANMGLEPHICDKLIHQVIIGAESKGAYPGRECKIEWVRSIVTQCKDAGVPVHVKQLHIDGKLIKKVTDFPSDLQIQQYPELREQCGS